MHTIHHMDPMMYSPPSVMLFILSSHSRLLLRRLRYTFVQLGTRSTMVGREILLLLGILSIGKTIEGNKVDVPLTSVDISFI